MPWSGALASILKLDMTLKDPQLLRGAWDDDASIPLIDVCDPATGGLVGQLPNAGKQEARQAIDAAERAFPIWRATTAELRAHVWRKLLDLMIRNQDDLALIIISGQGKPLVEVRGKTAYAASYVERFGEEARSIYGEVVPSPWVDKQIIVKKEPVGIFAAITT